MATVVTRGAKITRKQATTAATASAATASAEPSATAAAVPAAAHLDSTSPSAPLPAAAIPSVAPVAAARVTAAGCRSWIHGLTLTSTGVAGVDSVLGGGVALGSVMLLKEDAAEGAAAISVLTPFLASFVADGVGFGHRVLLVEGGSHANADAWLAALPRNLTLEKRAADAQAEVAALSASHADQQQHDLKIAWRYQQYVDRPLDAKGNLGAHQVVGASSGTGAATPSASAGSGASTRSVSSAGATLSAAYDYQSTISSQLLRSNPPAVCSIQEDVLPLLPPDDLDFDAPLAARAHSDAHRTALIYRHVLERVASFIAAAPAGSVSRILLHSLGSAGWCAQPESQSRALLVFLSHLRQLVATAPVLVMVSLPTGASSLLSPTLVRLAAHSADVVLALSGFSVAAASASAALLGDYDGILRVERAAMRHTLQQHTGVSASAGGGGADDGASAASSHCFLFKVTRRRIVVEKFALPPDAEDDPAPPQPAYVPAITTRGTSKPRATPHTHESPIAYEAEADDSAVSVLGSHLSRHGAAAAPTTSRSAAARTRDSPLHAILHSRSSVSSAGCSSTPDSDAHRLKGRMDF